MPTGYKLPNVISVVDVNDIFQLFLIWQILHFYEIVL